MIRHDETELEAFLNAEDELQLRRRKPHHLPDDCYAMTGVAYCVTLSARHQGSPFLCEAVAAGTTAALRYYRDRRTCAVYAYCLMPDHLHVVVSLLGRSLPSIDGEGLPLTHLQDLISRFKRHTTTQVAWKHGLLGKLWQRDFYDHIARGDPGFVTQCRYVLENPVRRKLVENWEDYPWSGIMDEWQEG